MPTITHSKNQINSEKRVLSRLRHSKGVFQKSPKMKEFAASLELDLVRPDSSEKQRIHLRVGIPQCESGVQWTCLSTDPMNNEMFLISGNDSIQALQLALSFIGKRMKAMKDKDFIWLYPETEDEFPIDTYFLIHESQGNLKDKGQA